MHEKEQEGREEKQFGRKRGLREWKLASHVLI